MSEPNEHATHNEAPPGKPSALPLIWCLFAAALFGAATPAAKPLLASINPVLLSGLLYAGAALAVLPWALRSRNGLARVDRRNWVYVLGSVSCGGIIGPVLLLKGLSMAPAGSVSLWLSLESVATALLARAFFREHLHASTWIAVVLIACASALLSQTTPEGGAAVAFVALACVAWGFDNNFTANIDRFTPAQVTLGKGVVAGGVNTVAGLLIAPVTIDLGQLTLSLAVGALGYGASILLYIRGAQQLGAARSQLAFATAPAFGLIVAWLVLDEPISRLQALAAGLMAAAIWLQHREHHEHFHSHERVIHTHAHRHDDEHHAHEHAEPVDPTAWHSHEHAHEPTEHAHTHRPDLHHRHRH